MSSIPAEGRKSEEAEVREGVKEILDLIDDARQRPSNQLKGEVELVESRLVALRDRLIVSLRRAEQRPGVQTPTLATINTALSLIVSIEYPGAGIHRQALVEANNLLKEFFAV